MNEILCSFHLNNTCEYFCVTCNILICSFCQINHRFINHLTYDLASLSFDPVLFSPNENKLIEIKNKKNKKIKLPHKPKAKQKSKEIQKIAKPLCQYCKIEINSDEQSLNCGHLVHKKCLHK